MWEYKTTLCWTSGKEGQLNTENNSSLSVGTPPEFGGSHDGWSPEQLLVGSVSSCLMTTALYFFERANVSLLSYSNDATATLERTRKGLGFTQITVNINVTIPQNSEIDQVKKALHSAKQKCPVSQALQCPVHVDFTISYGKSDT